MEKVAGLRCHPHALITTTYGVVHPVTYPTPKVQCYAQVPVLGL